MKFRKKLNTKSGIDLTPMIDIVFNLLIFFMVGTTMINSPQIKIDLPKSSSKEKVEKESIVISITRDGEFYLGTEMVDVRDLSLRLRNMANESGIDKSVVIQTDKTIESGMLIDAMDIVKGAGYPELSIKTAEK